MTDEEKNDVLSAYCESFTVREMNIMFPVRGAHKIRVESKKNMRDNVAGEFDKNGDVITYREGMTSHPEVVIHEAVHKLRWMDKERDGRFTRSMMGRRQTPENTNIEEAETTAETLARLCRYDDGQYKSYYGFLDDDDAVGRRMRRDDRALFVGRRRIEEAHLKSRAVDSVEKKFMESNISEYRGEKGEEKPVREILKEEKGNDRMEGRRLQDAVQIRWGGGRV